MEDFLNRWENGWTWAGLISLVIPDFESNFLTLLFGNMLIMGFTQTTLKIEDSVHYR